MRFLAILIALAAAVWAGYAFSDFAATDACLDAGGAVIDGQCVQ